ncbi:hypothetical protein MRB53_040173 [Persea americana]|nr:hypothetical protein MRB53_040173 [Persea americana]
MPRVRNNGELPHISSMGAHHDLNDDKEEKAARLHNRQAQYVRQMDELRAAAAPTKKRRSLAQDTPDTPRRTANDDEEFDVRGDNITPAKRVPILANFEEWMKLATDNKINANNSWNFALIDYFHDMSLLKEGDGVNFQKASCTLDGCVKIYTSRVDSVATETGKLLSGLADSGSKKRKDAEEDGEEGEEGEDAEDGGSKKKRSRAKRSAEATLVTSFDQLRLKKMELEFSVDPLFKKASADFDEGGAKGLLLNHLSIDSTGRIVFDSSDDAEEDVNDSRRDSMEPEDQTMQDGQKPEDSIPIDIAGLGARFFPDLNILDSQDICPSLKTFELGSGETSLDLPFLKASDRSKDEDAMDEDHDMDAGPGAEADHDDNEAGGWDMPDVGFGEGGEAWAKDAAMIPQLRLHDTNDGTAEDDEVGVLDDESSTYGITLQQRDGDEHDNILNYFDTALQKNWAGPEHWKITRIKDTQRASEKPRVRKEKEAFEIDFSAPMTAELASIIYTSASSNSAISMPKREWRSKNRNLLPDDKHFNSKDLLKLFLKPKAKLGLRKSEAQQKALATDGEIGEAYWAAVDAGEANPDDLPKGDYDANFFADDVHGGAMDDDDDEIFADAREMFSPDADGIDFGPSGPGIDGIVDGANAAEGAFGAQLITQSRRIRPEYVQYARVAKKVDVRRLKEEMWRGTTFSAGNSFLESDQETIHSMERFPGWSSAFPGNLHMQLQQDQAFLHRYHTKAILHDAGCANCEGSCCSRRYLDMLLMIDRGGIFSQHRRYMPNFEYSFANCYLDEEDQPQQHKRNAPQLSGDENGQLKFTDMMNNLRHVYPKQQLADISTSYGFICLLHLANEKGLVINNVDGWQDLQVAKDPTVLEVEEG